MFGFRKKKTKNRDAFAKDIYKILECNDLSSVTHYDNLVCQSVLYSYIVYESGKSNYILNSELAILDTVAFTMFVNSKEFLSGIYYEELIKKHTNIYFQKGITVLSTMLNLNKETIDVLFDNRITLYENLYKSSKEEGPKKYDSIIHYYEQILIQDKIKKSYHPYFENSAPHAISIFEHTRCTQEITLYLSKFQELYSMSIIAANDYLLSVQKMWDDYSAFDNDAEAQEYYPKKPIESILFNSMFENLRKGLLFFAERIKEPTVDSFCELLFNNLELFLNREDITQFDFSISCRDSSQIEYIDFHIEKNLIEIYSGGMAINCDIGSDSYTNWKYTIWNDGDEEAENISEESFDEIGSILFSAKAQLSISTPDEYTFDSTSVNDSVQLSLDIESEANGVDLSDILTNCTDITRSEQLSSILSGSVVSITGELKRDLSLLIYLREPPVANKNDANVQYQMRPVFDDEITVRIIPSPAENFETKKIQEKYYWGKHKVYGILQIVSDNQYLLKCAFCDVTEDNLKYLSETLQNDRYLLPPLENSNFADIICKISNSSAPDYGLVPTNPLCLKDINILKNDILALRDNKGMVYQIHADRTLRNSVDFPCGIVSVNKINISSVVGNINKSIFVCFCGCNVDIYNPWGYDIIFKNLQDKNLNEFIPKVVEGIYEILQNKYNCNVSSDTNVKLFVPTENAPIYVTVDAESTIVDFIKGVLQYREACCFLSKGIFIEYYGREIIQQLYAKTASSLIKWEENNVGKNNLYILQSKSKLEEAAISMGVSSATARKILLHELYNSMGTNLDWLVQNKFFFDEAIDTGIYISDILKD